jgi:hypothetical protein
MATKRIHPETLRLLATNYGPVDDLGRQVVTFEYTSLDGVPSIARAKADLRSRKPRLWCPRCGQRAKWLNATSRGLACSACVGRSA